MTSIFEYNKEEEEKKLRKAEYELGAEESTKVFIEILKELGTPSETIVEKIISKFFLSEAQAKKYVY